MPKEKPVNSLSFEEALKELEEIADNLEQGELPLEESLKAFERGTALSRYCHQRLEEAEQKIEILQKGENNSVEAETIKVKKDTGEVEDDEEIQGSLL